MPFGQPLGPPATRRQLDELLVLLHEAGHADFRDARGPMGFTQRQAGGRFTRDEAAAFIEALMDEADPTSDTPPAEHRRAPVTASERRAAAQTAQIQRMPSDLLAAELQRRGWAVIEP